LLMLLTLSRVPAVLSHDCVKRPQPGKYPCL
jgi:hypothetical protein